MSDVGVVGSPYSHGCFILMLVASGFHSECLLCVCFISRVLHLVCLIRSWDCVQAAAVCLQQVVRLLKLDTKNVKDSY